MKSTKVSFLGLGLGLVFLLFTSIPSLAGSVTDPSGDVLLGYGGIFDFVSGSGQVIGGNLILTVNFAPGTFDWSTAGIYADLDIDQNPSTGFPGINGAHTDSSIFGTDYLVAWGGSSIYGYYGLYKYNSGSFDLLPISLTTANSPNSTSVTIPLSSLGNDDGCLNFNFESTKILGPDAGTVILDYMPNPGSFGTTCVPEPSTMLLLGSGLTGVAGYGRKKFFEK